MKKSIILIFVLIGLLLIFSCKEEDKVTYGDHLQKEQVVISDLINKSGFKILEKYPQNGAFGDKDFFKLENGVYLRIIELGDTSQMDDLQPIILSTAKGKILESSVVDFDGFESEKDLVQWPLRLKYNGSKISYEDDYFLSEGYVSALKYVGNGGTVSMIIPFKIGSIYQKQSFVPIYFEKVTFIFEK